jgi:outer membrane receptor for ferric coprogen and ferric-rhodotorulic acid
MKRSSLPGALCRRPLAFAIHIALSAALAPACLTTAMPAAAQASAQAYTYDTPAGPLGLALTRIAERAGALLIFDPALAAGKTAPAVQGSLTLEQALRRALEGSGLEAVQRGSGYELRPVSTGETLLRPVKVRAQADGATTEGSGSYAAHAVTIGKTEQSLREIPQSVSVITRQRIEDQNMTTLTEALEQTTGITVTSTGTLRQSFMARGFALDVFQIDGMPYSPNVDVSDNPDLAIYDRVEVLRGAAGLLQGAGNPSGTVNLVRKRPTSAFAAALTAHAGSWANYRGDLDLSGPLNASGSLRARTVISYQNNNYFTDIAHQDKRLIYGIAEYDLTPTTLLTVGGTLVKTDATPDVNGLPTYSDGGDLHLPRSTFLGASWNRYRQDSSDGFVELRQLFDNGWTARLVGSYRDQQNDWANLFLKGPVDRESGSGGRAYASAFPDYLNRNYGADFFVSGPFELFGRSHELLFGGNVRRNNLRFSIHQHDGALGETDVLQWNPHAAPPDAFNAGPYFRYYIDETQSGAYTTLRFSLTAALKLIGGVRYSWWQDDSHYGQDAQWAGDSSHASQSRVPTRYGGVTYDLNRTYTLYASYADIFEPQTDLAYPGKVIDPIVGANEEAGIKGVFFDEHLNASLAVFRIEQKNRALTDPSHPCVDDADCYYIASGKVRSQGFEAEVQGDVTPDWHVFAGYTYVDTEYLKDRDADGAPTANEGRTFSTITPRHMAKLWSDYRLPSNLRKWTVGGGVQAQSTYYAEDGTVRITQGGYWLASAPRL